MMEDLIKDYKTYDPAKIKDKKIIADDFRIILAKYASMKMGKKTEFPNIEEVKKVAEKIVKDIVFNRDIVFHPEKMKPTSRELVREILEGLAKSAMYLIPPAGEEIKRNLKRAILKRVKLKEEKTKRPYVLCSGNKCYGIIRIYPGKPIKNFEEFWLTRKLHRISDEERIAWWGNNFPLQLYVVRDFFAFDKLKPFKLPKGARTFVRLSKDLSDKLYLIVENYLNERNENPSIDFPSLDDSGLIIVHGIVHEYCNDFSNWELAQKLHAQVADEMRRRNLEHRPVSELDIQSRQYQVLDDGKIPLDSLLSYFIKDIYLKKPFLSLVGGTVVNGMGNDIDLQVRMDESIEKFLGVIDFRLRSMLPISWRERVHFIDEPQGSFTNFVPLFDLVLRRRDVLEVEKMGIEEDEEYEDLQRVITPAIKRQAEISKRQDKIIHSRFFYMMKGIAGYRKLEVYNIPGLLEVLKEADYPYIIDQKFDGFRVKVERLNKKVKIISEGGKDYTHRFPTLVKAALDQRSKNFILDVELTGTDPATGKHMGRSDVAGYANAKGAVDDKHFALNIFTILYLNGKDLHKIIEKKRKQILDEFFDSTTHFNIAEWKLAKNEKEVTSAIKKFSKVPGSEGAMVKASEGKYSLTGQTSKWIKFKKEADLDAEVVAFKKVKGAQAYNYLCAVRDKKGKMIPVGETFNISPEALGMTRPLKVGEILRVAFVNINQYTDPKTNELWFNWWSPRAIEWREDRTQPDSLEIVFERVKQTSGEIEEKKYPKRYRELRVRLTDIYENLQKAISKKWPKNSFVMQRHWRGKSTHLDFRRKVNDHLEGETILDQPKGVVTKPVETLDDAKFWNKKVGKRWKFGTHIEPTKHAVVVKKGTQPLMWLEMGNKVVKPGEIGATKEFEGVFQEMDRGNYKPGTMKPWFEEYFLYGKNYKGRVVERLLKPGKGWERVPKKELHWEIWFTKDQIPYILTRRGRTRKDYTPPEGVSALSIEFEKLIPKELRWWEEKDLSKKEKLKRMDLAYNYLIDKKKLKGNKLPISEKMEKALEEMNVNSTEDLEAAKFALQLRWWKGQTVVRGLAKMFWDLRVLKRGKKLETWFLRKDPTLVENQAVTRERETKLKTPDGKSPDNWMTYEGKIPPNHPLNPNKKLEASVKIQDKGTVEIISETPQFLSMNFYGKILKGFWVFVRESPESDIWLLKRGKLPGVHASKENLVDEKIEDQKILLEYAKEIDDSVLEFTSTVSLRVLHDIKEGSLKECLELITR